MSPSTRPVCRTTLLAGLALLVVLLLAPRPVGAQGDPTALSLATPGSNVWSASMTVGNNRDLFGYTTFSERPVGALSSDSFVWRGTTYTVTNLAYNRSRGSAGTWDVVIDVWPPLSEGIECLTLRLGDQWLNLADARGNDRQFFWYDIELDWRFRDEVTVGLREFPKGFESRAIDGYANNRFKPEMGMANTQLLRMAGVSLAYGMTREPELDRPPPRSVSNIVSAQTEPMPNTALATDMVWQWGQFLDHDISLTPEATPGETLRIPIPLGDPVFDPFNSGLRSMAFNRSAVDSGTGTAPDNPREQINAITAFIDASNVYGSDAGRTRALRANDGTGRLKTSTGGLLPFNLDRIENDNGSSRQVQALFLAGDIRANEQVGLTALHTLFVREHNRLADLMEDSGMTGQEIFELARKIVGAQMQVVTYNEFLPLLLGPDAIESYEGYKPYIDAGIANEFSTAAYRFGHTMLSPSLLLIDDEGREQAMSLRGAFFNPAMITQGGISRLLRGLATQQAQRVDERLIDNVRNLLFGPPGGPGRDLAALNIQRGRDHGLPDYNSVRMAYGLPPARSFADVCSDPLVQEALESAYGELRYLDLWTAGLSEDHLPGAMLGETFHTIIADQFRRLRDGDRFWFENDPYFLANPELLADLRATTLADIIRRNTPIGDEIPDYVFGGPPRPVIVTIDLQPALTSFEWPGADGTAIDEALLEGGVFDAVVAIWEWDEATQGWLGFFPGEQDAPALNAPTVFRQGRTYWIVATEPVNWTVELPPAPAAVFAAGN